MNIKTAYILWRLGKITWQSILFDDEYKSFIQRIEDQWREGKLSVKEI